MEAAGTQLALFLQSNQIGRSLVRLRLQLVRLLDQAGGLGLNSFVALRNGWLVDVNRSYPLGYVDDDRRPRWRNGRFMSYYNDR